MKNTWEYYVEILKKNLFIYALLFTCFSYTQHQPMDTKQTKIKYGSIIEIKLQEKITLEDDLCISLRSFSHKNSVDGTLTKASAYLILSIHGDKKEALLSTYSNDHLKSEEELNSFEYTKTIEQENGMIVSMTSQNNDRFIFWKNYQIQLKEFEYDEFLKILVSKKTL
ncbi:hypothetical protein [Aquimarina amphilecti]|nr:hypothetical protein [Aquimarina amphilecti]